MKKPFKNAAPRAVLMGLLLLDVATGPAVAHAADWIESVRQCWNDDTPNHSIHCYFTEGKIRARRSGKACVAAAITAARSGDREGAVRWILACRCGDGPEVKNAIRDHADEVTRFAVDMYGAFVP